MQLFSCDHCRAPVYFDNYACVACGHRLAFLPDLRTMSALEELPEGPSIEPPSALPSAPGREEPPARAPRYRALAAAGRVYRMCQNYVLYSACSWAVPDEHPEPLCAACRLNDVIPDLSKPELHGAWLRLEAAKRRLLYSLYALGLPVESRAERPEGGLAFSFMASAEEQPVFTGHSSGLITINVAEADDPFREKMRAQLGETYRTLLGHFRHEIGHYYWERLIKDSDKLDPFRELFGDESLDYAQALDRNYKEGPPRDWPERFVSAYASMHPWEDWAETWAHYLHMFDTLDTAKAHGLRVRIGTRGSTGETVVDAEAVRPDDFEQMASDWIPLTLALNSLNRSMGLSDLYPFVLSPKALAKLRFVHEVIRSVRSMRGSVESRSSDAVE